MSGTEYTMALLSLCALVVALAAMKISAAVIHRTGDILLELEEERARSVYWMGKALEAKKEAPEGASDFESLIKGG